jgi:hypothetical protein
MPLMEKCTDIQGDWTYGARAPCSPFKKKLKMMFESFKKIGTKILEIKNYEIY